MAVPPPTPRRTPSARTPTRAAPLFSLAGLVLAAVLWPRPAATLEPGSCDATRGPVCEIIQFCWPVNIPPTAWWCFVVDEIHMDTRSVY